MEELVNLDDPRITTFGRLVEAHAALTDSLGRELESEIGLPLLWYGVLLHIGRSEGGIRPMSELVQATAFTSGGVTRLIDRMERAGLVERRPCPSDRRVQWVSLTDDGREMLERGTRVHLDGIQRHMVDRLEPCELEQLDRMLAKLAETGDLKV